MSTKYTRRSILKRFLASSTLVGAGGLPARVPKAHLGPVSLLLHATFNGSLSAAYEGMVVALRIAGAKPTYVPGVEGKAVRLWGWERQRIHLPGRAVVPTAGTVSLWFRPSDVGGQGWPLALLQPLSGQGPAIQYDESHSQWRASLGKGASCSLPFFQASAESWHHLAFTWDLGGRAALYFDARLLGYDAVKRAPKAVSWDFNELVLSCGLGPDGRYVDVCDLRCYRGALSATQVLALVVANAPIDVGLNQIAPSQRVVCGAANANARRAFAIKALADVRSPFRLETLGPDREVLWRRDMPLELRAGARATAVWTVPLEGRGGPATLKATLVRGAGGPSWAADIVRLPARPPQAMASATAEPPRPPLHVDCVAPPDEQRFLCSSPTRVTASPVGRYRESGAEKFSWFAYRFEVEHPGSPHRLSVAYPDDRPRTMAFDIADGTGRPPQGAGVQTGPPSVLTGRMQARDVVFWPATKHCALFVCNWSDGTPAAIASFDVREFPGGQLPALPVPARPVGTRPRHFGTYVEDASAFNFWGGAGQPSRLAQWKTTAENLASFLRYTGQDIYLYPMCWYSGPLFPSRTNDAYGNWDANRANHPDGAFDVMLTVLAQHGVKMMPVLAVKEMASLRFQTDHPAVAVDWPTYLPPDDWAQRYRGTDPVGNAILPVLRNGAVRQAWAGAVVPMGAFCGPLYNPLHPGVQAVLQGLLSDWLRLYGHYLGLAGVVLDIGTGWGGAPAPEILNVERLDADYSDFTVDLFCKEARIQVPGAQVGPDRFKRRYDFLTSPRMKERWVRWRCEKMRDHVILPLARKVWERRPDLCVSLMVSGNAQVGSPLLGKSTTFERALRECGIDLDMYKGIDRLSLTCQTRAGTSFGYPETALPGAFQAFRNGNETAVTGKWSPYWEYFQALYAPAAKQWPEVKPNVAPVRVITEQDFSILRDGALALLQEDVTTMLVGGMGQSPWQGHDRGAAHFSRAFRALPDAEFVDVAGLADPVRVRQWRCGRESYVYLTNGEPYAVAVDLQVEVPPMPGAAAGVSDLVSGETRRLAPGGALRVEVPAHQLCAWRLDNAFVSGGRALTPEVELETLRGDFRRMLASQPGDILRREKVLLALIRRALKLGHPARARGLLAAARARFPALAMESQESESPFMRWVLIGPFSTDQASRQNDLDVARPIEAGLLSPHPWWKKSYRNAQGPPATARTIHSRWRPYDRRRGRGDVNLCWYYPPPVLAYAITDLRSDRQREINLSVGWDDWAYIWVNGEKFLKRSGKNPCYGRVPGERVLRVRLRSGDNFVVVKIINGGGPGGFYCEPEDTSGQWPAGVTSVLPENGGVR